MRRVAPVILAGVLAEAATPRRVHEYSIDLGATLELIDFLGESGVTAIVLLGATGEFVHFALDDRRHMFNFAAKRSRLPLLVNVSHSTLDGAVELAREAAAAGAAGLLLLPPYYYSYGLEAISKFCLSFAAEVGEAAPIYLSGLAASTAIPLLATGLFAGIVEASGNLDELGRLAEQSNRTPFALLAREERTFIGAKSLGATGVVSGIASAVPDLMVALDQALETGASERIARLELRVIEFLDWTNQLPFPVGIKEAAKCRKLKIGALAAPLSDQEGRKLEEFREWFGGWLPAVLRDCHP